MCDEIINAADSVSTNVTNIILTNVTNNVSINADDKKVTYKILCYILHTVLVVIVLLFIIAIIRYHMQGIDQNQKTYCLTNNIKGTSTDI